MMRTRVLVFGGLLGVLLAFVIAAASYITPVAGACGMPGADPCPTYSSVKW